MIFGEISSRDKEKLKRYKRKWEPQTEYLPYRYIVLFCEKCGKKLGTFDIVTTDLDTNKYCFDCIKHYILESGTQITDKIKLVEDLGTNVNIEYFNNGLQKQYNKICYFNTHGRSIKINGRKIYLNTDK